jgi:ribosomal protein S6--L-glutamate ligase
MGKFNSFITEAKAEDKYRILVVSSGALRSSRGEVPKFHTAKRIEEEAKKLGHEVYILQVETAYITFENGIYKIYNKDDEDGFEINRDTIAIVRGTVRLKKSWLDLLSRLEKIGLCMVNSRETVEISSDKYRSYIKLQDAGLTQPKTVLVSSQETWKESLETLGSKFPIIMKTLEGSKGIGVLFIESERSLESLIQLLYSQNVDVDLLIQEYIKTDGDIRVLVLGDTIIGSMKRDVIEGDFRSNVSQGAKVKEYKLTNLEIQHSLLAAKAIGGSWTAVDFIPSKNPKKDPPYILEVNHSPGTTGIEEATGDNIVKQVVGFYSYQKNRHPVATEVGRFERLELKGLGQIVANFDTGNSARAIMHTDKWEVKGKEVVWESFGKTYTHKLQRLQKFEQGKWSWSSETPIERPVILLDVEFNGQIYKNHEFLLDDRGHKTTKCLMNQSFMRRVNVMINPAKTFVVSTKYGVKPDGTFEDDAFDLFNKDSQG